MAVGEVGRVVPATIFMAHATEGGYKLCGDPFPLANPVSDRRWCMSFTCGGIAWLVGAASWWSRSADGPRTQQPGPGESFKRPLRERSPHHPRSQLRHSTIGPRLQRHPAPPSIGEQVDHGSPAQSSSPVHGFPNGVVHARGSAPDHAERAGPRCPMSSPQGSSPRIPHQPSHNPFSAPVA